jgi:sec-independent protein translocase protein TatA
MGNLGFEELLVIGVAVLVLFGGKKIPEFMKGLGKGIREFKDAKDNVRRELEEGLNDKVVPNKPVTNTVTPANTVLANEVKQETTVATTNAE